jgi:hypothetical protein
VRHPFLPPTTGLTKGIGSDQGPATVLHSPATDFFEFMAEFRTLKLFGKYRSVGATDTVLSREYSVFLRCLGEESKSELALCDVAWWTHLLLTGVEMGKSDDESCQALPLGFDILGGIYCGVHKGMKVRNSLYPRRHCITVQRIMISATRMAPTRSVTRRVSVGGGEFWTKPKHFAGVFMGSSKWTSTPWSV